MRILIVRTSCRGVNGNSGFYNRQEVGLARALLRLGHQCDIVYFGGRSVSETTIEVDVDGSSRQIHLFFLKGIALYDSGLFLGLYELAEKYDVIQAHEYDQIESWLLAKRFPTKTIIYHGPYYSEFNKRYNLKCKLADTLFVPTYRRLGIPFLTKSRMAEETLREKGLEHVSTVGVGLDAGQLAKGPREECAQLLDQVEACKRKGQKVLLYVGRIEKRRNPHLLLDIVEGLRADVDVKLVVVGTGDESCLSGWKAAIEQKGLQDRVIHVERLAQRLLPYLYEACDLFLLPTSYEIFGMVLLEAMYYGLPVVTTENGGSEMLIQSGTNGEIVASLDAAEWARTVQSLLSDEGRLAVYSTRGKERIGTSYTWDCLAPRFLEAYSSMDAA